MTTDPSRQFIPSGEATAILPTGGKHTPITVIGTEAIRDTFDEMCLQQAINSRSAPGVTDLVLNPDAHCGYGAPVGCVLVSPTHIYPGPVGVDIKCSMSLLQTDLPAEAVDDRAVRRALINAICERTPTGAGRGQRSAKKSRRVAAESGEQVVIEGASAKSARRSASRPSGRRAAKIPSMSATMILATRSPPRLDVLLAATISAISTTRSASSVLRRRQSFRRMRSRAHRGQRPRASRCRSLRPARWRRCVSLALRFARVWPPAGERSVPRVAAKFATWDIPLPGDDSELVYAPLGTPEADAYLDDMALGANFATVNHLLINALVLEAFQEVFPGTTGQLVYFISHNIAQGNRRQPRWLGASQRRDARLSGGHHSLSRHAVCRNRPSDPAARQPAGGLDRDGRRCRRRRKAAYSVNHGAGRALGRKAGDPRTRSESRSTNRSTSRHPHATAAVSEGRSAGGVQGFRRSAAIGRTGRVGERSGAAQSAVRDQRWGSGGRLAGTS